MTKFTDIASFEQYVRENGTPDTMTIAERDFVMSYYDMSGAEIYYRFTDGSDDVLAVETENRYGDGGFTDAVVTPVMSPDWG